MKEMNTMKRFAVVLALVALAVCATTAAYGSSINLSESWYIKITNFSISPIMEDFWTVSSYTWSTTSLVEPKLQDPYGDHYRTLLFDFHAGTVTTNDYVRFEPRATVGSAWSGTMSFDWEIHCNNPQVLFDVDGGGQTWWTAPVGSSYRSGSASFYVSTWGDPAAQIPPALTVSFAPVPEPTSFAALLIPISLSGIGFVLRRSRR
jgi:hypothetical protein